MLRIYTAPPEDWKKWNDFVTRTPEGSFRQTTWWGMLKEKSGWRQRCIIAEDATGIRGGALIQQKDIPWAGKTLLYCCDGPIVDWKDKEVAKETVSGIANALRGSKGVVLRVAPEPPTHDREAANKILLYSGFDRIPERCTQWNRTLYTTRIGLHPDEDKLFRRMRRSHRQNINKAIRSGVSVSIDNTAKDKAIFCELMLGLESRRQSLIHATEYHELVFKNLVESGIGYFFKAIYQGRVISGLIVVILGDRAWAVFMANDYKHRSLMPNKLLLWEAMRFAKRLGCHFLDLGATQATPDFDPENDPLDRMKSAYRPEIIQYPGYYDYPLSRFYPLFRFAERRILPTLLTSYVNAKRTMARAWIDRQSYGSINNRNTTK